MEFSDVVPVTSEAELRAVVEPPLPRVARKDRVRLDELHRQWLARSPFCVIATAAADGRCDVSPKGDPPGFVHVVDDTTIVLPERPGNRRCDGFHNVISNPHVGLIFLVPGRGDTLRVNGRAAIVRDAPFFDDLIVAGHRPRLAMIVHVEQVFFHCAKAFLRSKLWDTDSWAPDALPSRARIAQRLERPDDSLESLEHYYGPAYAEKLYG